MAITLEFRFFSFIFGKNIPIFTGLYENENDLFIIIDTNFISLYLLKQKMKIISKTFLIIFLFFQIICGFMSASRVILFLSLQ